MDTVVVKGLLFSPIKLGLLVVWVYGCMYLVQRFEFSPLIGNRFKGWINLLMLVAAPFVLLVLLLLEVLKKIQETGISFAEAIKSALGSAVQSIKYTKLGGARGSSSIILLDPSGKNINEVYGGQGNDDTKQTVASTEKLIGDAVELLASDILINPIEGFNYDVRFRIDGIMQPYTKLSPEIYGAVVNSIKAISSMDISEKRRPQDGAFVAKIPNGTVSFRVASAGVLHGEKLSIRILNQNLAPKTLPEIGMDERACQAVRHVMSKDTGMIIMCGPTGSGKSTTLYAMLREIDFYAKNVITIEDPVEYVLPGAGQIEVNPKADITFAKALRSILRQDPDVICVGEIRDDETASIALKAAQTGHLVIATLHSNSNSASLVRLLDLGISPLLMASGLDLLVSQRLIRKLCDNCKRPANMSEAQRAAFQKKNIDTSRIYEAAGCSKCHNTGYKGRIGVFDVMLIDAAIKNKISTGDIAIITAEHSDEKMKATLNRQALRHVIAGVTSLEEAKKVTSN
ncbi:MAG: GspE/PulE family protein [Planctomycetaceae bacterium]|nr:GspE/PulE family protein [Planctomycetaceae bacterium]